MRYSSAVMGGWPEVSHETQGGPLQPATRMLLHGWAGAMPRRVLSVGVCWAGRKVAFTAVLWCEWWSEGRRQGVNVGVKFFYCIFEEISAARTDSPHQRAAR